MMTLTGAVRRRIELLEEIEAAKVDHKIHVERLTAEVARCTEVVNSVEAGIDSMRVALAESLMSVGTDFGPHGDQSKIVSQAIRDICDGCVMLRKYYMGTKHYSSWWHQGTSHEYGYGPRHGAMAWRISLKDDTRARIKRGESLSEAETDAMIYYLLNLKAICKLKESARAEAASV